MEEERCLTNGSFGSAHCDRIQRIHWLNICLLPNDRWRRWRSHVEFYEERSFSFRSLDRSCLNLRWCSRSFFHHWYSALNCFNSASVNIPTRIYTFNSVFLQNVYHLKFSLDRKIHSGSSVVNSINSGASVSKTNRIFLYALRPVWEDFLAIQIWKRLKIMIFQPFQDCMSKKSIPTSHNSHKKIISVLLVRSHLHSFTTVFSTVNITSPRNFKWYTLWKKKKKEKRNEYKNTLTDRKLKQFTALKSQESMTYNTVEWSYFLILADTTPC